MKVAIRIPGTLYASALADLERTHPFAAERIGFFSASCGHGNKDENIVCLTAYHPVADDDYVDDPCAGARINSRAIRSALQRVLDEQSGQIHVHLHHHRGRPAPSSMDARELPPLIRSFSAAGPQQVSGGLILSLDSAWADLWLPGHTQLQPATRITSVGFPLRFLL